MGLIPTLNTFVPGTPIRASTVNENFDRIVTVVNGQLDDINILQISAEKVTSGEFDPDRIPRLSEDKLPQAAQGFLKAKGATTDPAYELVQWVDVQDKPAQATRWPTWGEVEDKPSLDDPSVIGVLPVSKGGTNVTSLTGDRYIRSNTNGTAVETRSNFQVLSDIGAATADHTHSLSSISIKDVLPVSKGGLGSSSLDPSGYLVAGPFGDEVVTLSASSVRVGIGANNADNLSTGTVPRARLPVGAIDDTQVAPGQGAAGSIGTPVIGALRLLVKSTAGDVVEGSFYSSGTNLAKYVLDGTALVPIAGTAVTGTWQALNAAEFYGNNTGPFLAVRVS